MTFVMRRNIARVDLKCTMCKYGQLIHSGVIIKGKSIIIDTGCTAPGPYEDTIYDHYCKYFILDPDAKPIEYFDKSSNSNKILDPNSETAFTILRKAEQYSLLNNWFDFKK